MFQFYLQKNFPLNLQLYGSPQPTSCLYSTQMPTSIALKSYTGSRSKAEGHCYTLKKAVKKDSECGTFSLDFAIGSSNPPKAFIWVRGKTVDKLERLCGKDISLSVDVRFSHLQDQDVAEVLAIFNDKTVVRNMPILRGTEFDLGLLRNYMEITQCSIDDGICYQGGLAMPEQFAEIYEGLMSQKPELGMNLIAFVDVYFSVNHRFINDDSEMDTVTSLCKDILISKLNSDICIVARNHVIVKCHRNFLAANSPVLARVCRRSVINRIYMVDMSKESVMALLEFMYTRDITTAFNNSKVAVDLFKTSLRYEIETLEERMAELLYLRNSEWYQTDVASDLYRLVRNSGYTKLEVKMARILAARRAGDQ
ncbi:hypothetical protein Ocin01_05332 [Orchesella cincta]|uniref:BTB domain-containing protein n=1 Tax=Orchesella cincta TaxID=48709 RepID=A0A1D2N7X3_ORCCI|nr:hypothetical protein Ocin01_05332 [Orchesella cincta]